MPSKPKAIIIGAGVAGLATAIRLSVQGFDVCVFEKNENPGGKLYVFEKDGYRFDTGPSLFVQPQNIQELFTLAGGNIHDHLQYKPVEIACKYFYEDGTVINAHTNAKKFAAEIEQKTGEPAQHVISYLKDAEKIYKNIAGIFLDRSLHTKDTWLNNKILNALASTRLRYLFSSLHSENKKNFDDTRVVQLFDRFATYSGSNPYKAPAMLKLIAHLEINEGVFYPRDGMVAINNALYDLAVKKNVQFFFNAPVEKIITSNKRAKGIVINNKEIFSDIVISNADAYFTYRDLLNDEQTAKKILQQERSSSAMVFYWGINKTFPQLLLHNIFFSNDYKAEFNSIFNDKTSFSDPTIYINITSKMEPGIHAPVGKENWFVMVNVPSAESMNDEAIINTYKENILARLSHMLHTEIEPAIESEGVLYPGLIETQTASYLGALYGTSSNSIQAAFLRHPNFSKHIQGLYFAGGSVHPGGGIPLCLKSAKITSDIIARDHKKYKQHE
jgi:phytoene desaturase